MTSPLPVALTINGSDCSAGAGLQADLKTFSRFGVHGLTVVTSVMAETPLAVAAIRGVEAKVVKEQIRVLLDSFVVGAVKTGVLHSGAHVMAVAAALDSCEAPLVIDPAMLTATGESLLSQDAVEAYKDLLFPSATLITPNLQEARYLLGGEAKRVEEPIEVCAKLLHETYGCSVLVTGFHDSAANAVVDYLLHNGQGTRLVRPWIEIPYAHGTGCTFTAALTAGLARGRTLPEAVAVAEKFIGHALENSFRWETRGRDLMVLNHFSGEVFGEE
jgi:hydroxymethylpyrimidine/phosphomethylpyrimidine kinase